MTKTIFNFYPLMLNMIIIFLLTLPSLNKNFHPINLALILIFLTFLITLKMNFLLISITPFILFLIIIGGLMIIFLYITSLSNNEIFTFNLTNIKSIFLKFFIISMIFYILNLNLIYPLNFNLMNIQFMYISSFLYNNNITFVMNYLFYSMICITHICYKFKMPLRQLTF